MARNRSELAADSLELLLDTICNVFGGIILMAILVVMQAQAGAGRLPQPTAQDVDRAIQAKRLRFEAGRLRERLVTLREQESRVDETFYAITSPTGERLSRTIEEFRRAIDDATRRAAETQKETGKARRNSAEVADSLANADRLVAEKQAEIERLERELHDDRAPAGKHLRLPHRRGSARGMPRYYIIRGDCVFPFGMGSLPHWDGPAYDVEACLVTPLIGNLAAAVQPIADRAVTVPAEGAPTDAFRVTLAACRPDSHYLVLFVYPDDVSYAAFQRLKRVFVDLRYNYVLSTKATPDEVLIVSPVAYHETE